MNPELASALSSHVVPAFQGNNVVQMASSGSDKNLTARFFLEPVYQEFESEKQGRAVYKDEAFVHICAPGAKTDIIKKVQMEDRMDVPSDPRRFPRQWQQFTDQQTQVPDGTPLEMCAFLPKHRVMELKAVKIFTAENYAELPDSAGQTLGMGWQRERELCRAYLSEDNKVQALSKALAEKNAMAADIAALREQIAALGGRAPVAAAPVITHEIAEQPAKRKYTRRAQQGE
jgi:hypothetical protein